MPTRKITAEEFGRRNPQAKGVFRTTKKGQKVFIAFEKKRRNTNFHKVKESE